MIILNKKTSEESIKTDVLVLPYPEETSADIYSDLDVLIGGLIKKVVRSKEFTGKHNQFCLLHVGKIKADRILLAGLGKSSEITPEKIRQTGGKTISYLKGIGIVDAALSVSVLNSITEGFPALPPLFYFLEGGMLGLYSFKKYKKTEDNKEIKKLTILDSDKKIDLDRLNTVVSAVNFARDIINTPSNDMTPGVLAGVARNLSKKVRTRILERKDVEKEGMGAFLSVARGSAEPLKFIVMEYRGAKKAPIVLIGKSITFDSGGISLKPADGMEKMKYDMAGGAAVLAIIKAISEMRLPLNIVCILPATENLPGGHASRPGDVVRSIAGKTVEIINTDAEGRLALADAIGYAIKYFNPAAIIDIATLTGACSIALGNEAIAMMGNDEGLMQKMKKSSGETYERVWQMPLYDEYKEYIKSDVADLKNTGGRNGSLGTSGYFLKEFAGETPWVHLDIASTAWNDGDKPYLAKGASGIGVRLLLDFLTAAG